MKNHVLSTVIFSSSLFANTELGFNFKIQSFKENGLDHFVIFTETLSEIPHVRIHSECLTGDVFKSVKCDCGEQLDFAMKKIRN